MEAEVGLAHGVVHEIMASHPAKVPGLVPLGLKTKVKQPEVLFGF